MKSNLKNFAKLMVLIFAITITSCTKNDSKDEVATTQALSNIAPANAKTFSPDEVLKPIVFRWTPIVPKPQSVVYRLKVWQLMQGQSGWQAMRTNQPIVTKDIANATEVTIDGLYTGPCRPPYLCDFIWMIQAIDKASNTISESQGTSVATTFSF